MGELRKENVNFIYLHVLKVISENIMTRTTQNSIKWTCNEIRDLLVSKNKAYGDSAITPDNIFNKLDNAQAISARIDDKLSRIKNNGLDDATEDTLDDLIGYLILLKIAREGGSNSQTVTVCNCVHGMHEQSCECYDAPTEVKVKVFAHAK
tara:strand:+ start:350 stop:802 length:453 start_codon:yes stop_codon:yes gene_type:complete